MKKVAFGLVAGLLACGGKQAPKIWGPAMWADAKGKIVGPLISQTSPYFSDDDGNFWRLDAETAAISMDVTELWFTSAGCTGNAAVTSGDHSSRFTFRMPNGEFHVRSASTLEASTHVLSRLPTNATCEVVDTSVDGILISETKIVTAPGLPFVPPLHIQENQE